MGNLFSGHYGRRSRGPYLDQIPRVVVAQVPKFKDGESRSGVFFPFNGLMHPAAVVRIRVGALDQYLFICPECQRCCRILYLIGEPICRYCTGASYRVQSESPGIRMQRKADKFLRSVKLNSDDPQRKIRSRHWVTHQRLIGAAKRAGEIIFGRHEQILSQLHRAGLKGRELVKDEGE